MRAEPVDVTFGPMARDWRLWLSVASVLLVVILGFTVNGNAERADRALAALERAQQRADRLEQQVENLEQQVTELTQQIETLQEGQP